MEWQESKDPRIVKLQEDLARLDLTSKIESKRVNETAVELRVGRLRRSGTRDMVSIADVGVGVSQVLPVLVALRVAKPGQMVYIEQPEIHLHPKAQVALAEILADAANRDVQVVVETHSSHLLLAIQSLVAEGKLDQRRVGLNWFRREDDGSSKITTANLDDRGAFGDWPEDFGDVELELESRYLSAARRRAIG